MSSRSRKIFKLKTAIGRQVSVNGRFWIRAAFQTWGAQGLFCAILDCKNGSGDAWLVLVSHTTVSSKFKANDTCNPERCESIYACDIVLVCYRQRLRIWQDRKIYRANMRRSSVFSKWNVFFEIGFLSTRNRGNLIKHEIAWHTYLVPVCYG